MPERLSKKPIVVELLVGLVRLCYELEKDPDEVVNAQSSKVFRGDIGAFRHFTETVYNLVPVYQTDEEIVAWLVAGERPWIDVIQMEGKGEEAVAASGAHS